MIAMHPEAGASSQEVRWILAEPTSVAVGQVVSAPFLTELLADGSLASVSVAGDCVVTVAGAGQTWTELGARVRTALSKALERPQEWSTVELNIDAEAVAAAEQVLAGEFGDYVRSHGGGFDIVGVHDGVLDIKLTGTCHGCPAATMSLRAGFERRLKSLCPQASVK